MNMNSNSALVRSGQMDREQARERAHTVYQIEDEAIISLCIKRLGLTKEEFEGFMKLPPKTFHDYPNSYRYLSLFKYPIKALAYMNLVPKIAYYKYFYCGS
jgi:hypothetical protein